MRIIISIVIVFISGFNIANNLANLIPINEAYQAAWWKVWLSLIIAIGFAGSIYIESKLNKKE